MEADLNTKVEDIDLQKTPFATDTLLELNTQDIDIGEPTTGSVDLSKVIGTTHPDYCGKTWGELKPIIGTSGGNFIENNRLNCQPLKRAYGNVMELEKTPHYYLNNEEKHHWSFYEIEGDYYISAGNNRTVIGRLFLHLNNKEQIIHGVKITPATFKALPVIESSLEKSKFSFIKWLKNLFS